MKDRIGVFWWKHGHKFRFVGLIAIAAFVASIVTVLTIIYAH